MKPTHLFIFTTENPKADFFGNNAAIHVMICAQAQTSLIKYTEENYIETSISNHGTEPL